MAKNVNFFDGANSSTVPTIGNIAATDLVPYANDAAYEADNAGAPAAGDIYYNTTLDEIRYYDANTAAWTTVRDTGTQINATEVGSGSVDNTEFGYLDGATSNIQTQLNTNATAISDHLADTVDAHDASAISNVPSGNLAATDVQSALDELQTDVDSRIPSSEKGANNGVATLDGGGKVPVTQLPSSVMEFKGTFDPATATFTDAGGDAGDVWQATAAGSYDAGSGSITYAIGDWAVHNGSVFEKSLNSNAVSSVNGQSGVVVLDTDDISEGSTNLYFTDGRAQTAVNSTHANNTLSNLTSPTAVNQDLIMNGTTLRLPNDTFLQARNNADSGNINLLKLRTDDELQVESKSFDLRPFTSAWWGSDLGGLTKAPGGPLSLGFGTEDHATNSVDSPTQVGILTGDKPGASSTGNTGTFWFHTGDNAGSGNSGSFLVFTGSAANAGSSGSIELFSGDPSGSGNSGQVVLESGAANSGNSGFAELKSGNSTSGNSGDVRLTVGTAGATQGNFKFLRTGDAPTVGDVWTATNVDGSGYWAAAPVSGNSWSDPVDANIEPDGNQTRDLGTATNNFDEVHAQTFQVGRYASGSVNFLSGSGSGAVTAFMTGDSSLLGNLPSGTNANLKLRLEQSTIATALGIYTNNSATANATATGDLRFETGNKSAGTGDSGSMYFQTGTSTGGNRGQLVFKDGSEGTSGHVWTSTGTGGEGAWAAPSGSSGNKTVTSYSSTATASINDDVILLSGASFTLTLPTASGNSGKVFEILHTGTNLTQVYTIDGNAAETIRGALTFLMHTNGQRLRIVSDGTNWQVLDHYAVTDWINFGAIPITATTTNPTKGTTANDALRWRRLGNSVEIRGNYRQTAGGTVGSGDYLYGMPTNISIDTSKVEVYSGVEGSGAFNNNFTVGAGSINNGTQPALASVVVYDANNLRNFAVSATGNGVHSSAYYAFGNADLDFSFNAILPVLNWEY